MQHPSDLREHIEALEKLGDLDHVHEQVDWNLEAAAQTRYSTERRLPAPLFENVAGVADGFRLLGAPAALSSDPSRPYARVALSVGLRPEATGREIVEHLVATRHRPGVPPVAVAAEAAPVKQNVLLGEDADLNRFPVPFVHEGDGNRYANTYGVIIARTPDGSWTNWSIARIMMIDGKHMTGLVMHPQHIAQVWQQWADLGKPMPYALVQGGDPAIPYVGGIPIGDGVAEAAYVGALIGRPLEVVEAELSDLMVPAGAEIVIEGHLSVQRDGLEGPFGEFAGYVPRETSLQPVYSVEAITHRDAPIWPLVAEGRPVDDFHTVTGIGEAAGALDAIREAGLPAASAWAPLSCASHWLVVTAPGNWRELLPGVGEEQYARRVGEAVFATRFGSCLPQVFLLDDDFDPTDDADLLWALATRVHPDGRVVRFEDGPVLPLLTCYTAQERHAARATKVVHEALLPAPGERERQSTFADAYPVEVRAKVLARYAR
ncbi:UbiD family decarboxylase [Streptomyces albospinus]|uniref:UbiD family decarboxylase n=1 Tax=Streptomyces albospinus TaxID=285515 RepID=UPI001671448A|nr:UbiD family decarboxylase [Streptomyces albospinus]